MSIGRCRRQVAGFSARNGSRAASLDALAAAAEQVGVATRAGRRVAPQRPDMLVDGVEEVGRIGEEGVLHLVGGGNPVAGAHHHGRGVQVVEGQARDAGRQGLEGRAALAGVAGQKNLAGLAEKSLDKFSI